MLRQPASTYQEEKKWQKQPICKQSVPSHFLYYRIARRVEASFYNFGSAREVPRRICFWWSVGATGLVGKKGCAVATQERGSGTRAGSRRCPIAEKQKRLSMPDPRRWMEI